MQNCKQNELLISGIGVISAAGQGKSAFVSALMEGKNVFRIMQRPGRQKDSAFIGAEMEAISFPGDLSQKLLRTASLSAQAALVTLLEAWEEARLYELDPEKIGLVIGGSNVQQREIMQTYERFGDKAQFIRPTYALSFMDSDLCGLCTERFGIKGLAYMVGGASASGQLSILHAAQAVLSEQVDVCIAMGALMDISYMECQAFRALGAMGTDKFSNEAEKACRPFDVNHDGFIFGEGCGVLVIERADSVRKRGIQPYARLSGWSIAMDGNRNPDPSYEGESHVIKKALEMSGIEPQKIDYINPHGTGSIIGDETELRAIRDCKLSHAFINATKSITGHGLSAAGALEAVTVILQMKESRLHPTLNLENPIDPSLNWVRNKAVSHKIENALSLSMGFGGINTAITISSI